MQTARRKIEGYIERVGSLLLTARSIANTRATTLRECVRVRSVRIGRLRATLLYIVTFLNLVPCNPQNSRRKIGIYRTSRQSLAHSTIDRQYARDHVATIRSERDI